MLIGLIKNEFIKLFSKKKTYIILFLFIVLSGLFVVVKEQEERNYLYEISSEGQSENINREIEYLKEEERNQTDKDIKQELQGQILELETQRTVLEEDVNAGLTMDEELLNNGINYLMFNILIVASGFMAFGLMLFNADNVSNEYNPGTLKFLLIQPVSRVKILLSKFIVMVVSSIGLIMGTQGLFYLGVGLFKGFGNLDRPMLVGLKFEKVVEDGQTFLRYIENTGYDIKLSEYLLRVILLEGLFILVMVSFILMISTISKSSVVSLTIGIGCIIGTTIIASFSDTYRSLSHLIFFHFNDIGGIITGEVVQYSGSLNFTYTSVVIVSLITTLVFLSISLMIFKKRDVLI